MTNINCNLKRDAVIFDIDRTLADISNLEHLFELPEADEWFPTFHSATLHVPTIKWVEHEVRTCLSLGVGVIAVTARPEKFFEVTLAWFNRHELMLDDLFMRPNMTRDADYLVKESMLPVIRSRWNPVKAFDDKQEIVDMWERNGIPSVLVEPVPIHRE